MTVCVIDGRGGGLGGRLIAGLRTTLGESHKIVGLGTNMNAAQAMKQAGAHRIGIGESAISRIVPVMDVIVASLNLVLPGSMLGEVTPTIVRSILSAPGEKLLLPLNTHGVEIVGSEGRTLDLLIGHTAQRIRSVLQSGSSA
jgi:hypothetical protein